MFAPGRTIPIGRAIGSTAVALAGAALALPLPATAESAATKAERTTVVAPVNLARLAETGRLRVSAPEAKSPVAFAFDGRTETHFQPVGAGPLVLDLELPQPKVLRSVRLLLGGDGHRWSVTTAERAAELGEESPPVPPARGGRWVEADLKGDRPAQMIRLRVYPDASGRAPSLRELRLIAVQELVGLRVEVPSGAALVGGGTPIRVIGEYTGGAVRRLGPAEVKLTAAPTHATRILSGHRLYVGREGQVQVHASVGSLHSRPVRLYAVQ